MEPDACSLKPEASRDFESVARQLGREPRPFRVATRCPFGAPSVIENERDRNMPTSFWVTCPSLDRAISRLESTGGVLAAREDVGVEAVEEIHAKHLARYGTRVAGVGGPGGHVKCLHAFTAIHLSGAIANAIAEWTLERLEKPFPEDSCCTREDART
jgi:uncharacterized protein